MCNENADRITRGERHRSQSERHVHGKVPLAQRLLGKRHRRRRIQDQPCGQQGTVFGQPDVRAIATSQQFPVELPGIVALAIQPVFGELRRGAAEARAVCPRKSA